MAEKRIDSPFTTDQEKIDSILEQRGEFYGVQVGQAPIEAQPVEDAQVFPPLRTVGSEKENTSTSDRINVQTPSSEFNPGSGLNFGDSQPRVIYNIAEFHKNRKARDDLKKAA